MIAELSQPLTECFFQNGVAGEIDGNRRDQPAFPNPFLKPQTHKFKHKEIDLADRLGFFQQRDESIGRQDQIFIQLIPDQRFSADQKSGVDRNFRLEINEEAAFIQLLTQNV